MTEVHGEYVIPAIPPGKYELVIRAKGVAYETRTDISLDSGQASTLNVAMNAAGATQQVLVSEAPPLLQTTTATVGTVVATEQIRQLPLLGRVLTSVLLVAPGVSTAPTPRGGPLGATTGANSAITKPIAKKGVCCEVDHLISLELGGSNRLRNLWPEPYNIVWNAHVKDRLENRLHQMVCAGELDLTTAQQAIASDWIAAYKRYESPNPQRARQNTRGNSRAGGKTWSNDKTANVWLPIRN